MIKRFLSLMLIAAFALAMCGAAHATAIDESLFENAAESTPAPTSAPVNAKESKLTDDGMLRVWLRSLGAPERLTLTIAGPYTIENDADGGDLQGVNTPEDLRLTEAELRRRAAHSA